MKRNDIDLKDIKPKNVDDIIKGASGAGDNIPTAFKQKNFASSYESRINQTPAPSNKKVQFIDVDARGEARCILKPPPDEEIEKILKNAGIDGIMYKNGVPDFSPTSVIELEIDHMVGGTGSMGNAARKSDFKQANEALAEQLNNSPELAKKLGMNSGNIKASDIEKYRVKNNLTWHELNNGTTMQLVPSAINNTFGHLGGVGEINAGLFK